MEQVTEVWETPPGGAAGAPGWALPPGVHLDGDPGQRPWAWVRPQLHGWPVPVHDPPDPRWPAEADPATQASLLRARRRAWRMVGWTCTLLAGSLLVVIPLGAADRTTDLASGLSAISWLLGVFLLLALPLHALTRRRWDRARRILRQRPWQLVECVTVDGTFSERKPSVVILEPGSGRPVAVWTVLDDDPRRKASVRRSWWRPRAAAPGPYGDGGTAAPPGLRREWGYLALDEHGRRAVLADVHRSQLRGLEAAGSADHGHVQRAFDLVVECDLGTPHPATVPPGTPLLDPSRDRYPRMTSRQRWITVAVLAVLVPLAILGDHRAEARGRRNFDAVMAHGQRSQATVASDPGYETVEIHIDDGAAAGWTVRKERESLPAVAEGDRVTVAYSDARDLSDLVVVGGRPQPYDPIGSQFLTWGSVIAVLVIGWGAFVARRRKPITPLAPMAFFAAPARTGSMVPPAPMPVPIPTAIAPSAPSVVPGTAAAGVASVPMAPPPASPPVVGWSPPTSRAWDAIAPPSPWSGWPTPPSAGGPPVSPPAPGPSLFDPPGALPPLAPLPPLEPLGPLEVSEPPVPGEDPAPGG